MGLQQGDALTGDYRFRARLQNQVSRRPYRWRILFGCDSQKAAVPFVFKTLSPAIGALPAGLRLAAEPEGDG